MKPSAIENFGAWGTVFSAVCICIGFICWLTSMNNKVFSVAEAQTVDREERIKKEDKIATQLEAMNTRLSMIEGEVKEIGRALK